MCLRHERTVKLTIEVSLHRLNQSSIVRSVARFNDLPQSVLHQARKDQRASDQQRQRDTVLADVKDASRRLGRWPAAIPCLLQGRRLTASARAAAYSRWRHLVDKHIAKSRIGATFLTSAPAVYRRAPAGFGSRGFHFDGMILYA